MATATRRIHFSKVRFLKKESDKDDQLEVEAVSVLSAIGELPFADNYGPNSRYLALDEGDLVAVQIDSLDANLKGKIGRKRLTNLPSVEYQGDVTPLTLPSGSGLFETSHFVLFPDGVIGYEANFFGPRLGRLCSYLEKKASDLVDRVEYQLLWTRDVEEKIRDVQTVTIFSMRAHRDLAESIMRHDGELGRVFAAARELSPAAMLQIDLRVEKNKRKGFNLPWIGNLVPMLGDGDLRQGIESLWLRAKNENERQSRFLDLLQDALISTKSVLKTDDSHRTVEASSMYEAIEQARGELSTAIDSAVDSS